MVRLDFHARVQTGNIFCGNHDAFRAVRSSEGRRSSVPVAWHRSLLLILRTISPRDYVSTGEKGKSKNAMLRHGFRR